MLEILQSSKCNNYASSFPSLITRNFDLNLHISHFAYSRSKWNYHMGPVSRLLLCISAKLLPFITIQEFVTFTTLPTLTNLSYCVIHSGCLLLLLLEPGLVSCICILCYKNQRTAIFFILFYFLKHVVSVGKGPLYQLEIYHAKYNLWEWSIEKCWNLLKIMVK